MVLCWNFTVTYIIFSMEELKKQPEDNASDASKETDAPETSTEATEETTTTESEAVTTDTTSEESAKEADTTTEDAEAKETAAEPASVSEAPEAASTAPSSRIPRLYIIFAVVIAALLIIGVMNHKGMFADQRAAITNHFKANSAVAMVNDTKITHEDYQTSVTEITQNATLQGFDVSTPETQAQIEEQALTALINTELLVQKASEAGFSASSEAVEEEYGNLVTQLGGEELLTEKLTELNMTPEELRENITEQVAITAYIDAQLAEAGIAVTEEDITEFYNTVVGAGDDAPPLEEIRPFLEEQLLAGKEQEFIIGLVDTLRSEATIDIKI